MPTDQITPEMRAFAQELATMVRNATCEEHRRSVASFKEHMDRRFDEMQIRIEAKISELRAEVRAELKGLRDEQHEQRDVLEDHTASIARIEERLKSGDQRMQVLEARENVTADKAQKNAISLAVVATAVGKTCLVAAGGGAAAYIMAKLSGGGM